MSLESEPSSEPLQALTIHPGHAVEHAARRPDEEGVPALGGGQATPARDTGKIGVTGHSAAAWVCPAPPSRARM